MITRLNPYIYLLAKFGYLFTIWGMDTLLFLTYPLSDILKEVRGKKFWRSGKG